MYLSYKVATRDATAVLRPRESTVSLSDMHLALKGFNDEVKLAKKICEADMLEESSEELTGNPSEDGVGLRPKTRGGKAKSSGAHTNRMEI